MMEAVPKVLRSLLSRTLPKIHIAIDALTSLRDVPVILEDMVFRLTFLEYAMLLWRQAQSHHSQVKSESLCQLTSTCRPYQLIESRLIWKMAITLYREVLVLPVQERLAELHQVTERK